MSQKRQEVGRWGEKLAAAYLAQQGYDILEQNVRTAYGEIDLVVQRAHELVFVEVKTRRSLQYGFPEESVHARKQEHLRASALAYLQTHPDLEMNWRIDVIAILDRPGSEPELTHFENAVQ